MSTTPPTPRNHPDDSLLLPPLNLKIATTTQIGGSPYHVMAGSSHPVDPHGLNAFLLHPNDGLWDYINPAGRRVDGEERQEVDSGMVSSVGDKEIRLDSPPAPAPAAAPVPFTRRSRSSINLPKSPLSNPPLVLDSNYVDLEKQLETKSSRQSITKFSGIFGRSTKKKNENSAVAIQPLSSLSCNGDKTVNSARILQNGTLLLPCTTTTTTTTRSSDLVDETTGRSHPIHPITSPALISPSSRSISAHSVSSSQSSVGSDITTLSEGMRTPAEGTQVTTVITMDELRSSLASVVVEKSDGDNLDEDALVMEVPTMPEKKDSALKRSLSASGWKGWLSIGSKKTGKDKMVPLKPAPLNVDVPPTPGLSADPTAGVLPSSVSPSLPVIQAEELHVPSATPSTLPPSVIALREKTLVKLSALRAASPNPITSGHTLPRHLSLVDERTTASWMRFPRSVNPRRLPGDGLTPAEAGLRIDIGIRALLKKMDTEVIYNVHELSSSVLSKQRGRPLRRRSSFPCEPGITLFIQRLGFENRVWEISSTGAHMQVESACNRALEELEFSIGLEALAIAEKERKAIALQRPPFPRRRPRFDSTDSDRRGVPPVIQEEKSDDNDTNPAHGRSMSSEVVPSRASKYILTTRTASYPELTPLTTRPTPTFQKRRSAVDWQVSDSSESEDEAESDDDDPRRMSKSEAPLMESSSSKEQPSSWTPPITTAQMAREAPHRRSMLLVPKQQQPAAAPVSSTGPPREKPGEDLKEEDYKRQVLLARERRQSARNGETERRATAQVLIAAEKAKRPSMDAVSGTTAKSAPSSPPGRPKMGLSAEVGEIPGQPRRRTMSTFSGSSSNLREDIYSPSAHAVKPLTRRSLSQHDLAAQPRPSRQSAMFLPAMMGMPMMSPPLSGAPIVYVPVVMPHQGQAMYPSYHPMAPSVSMMLPQHTRMSMARPPARSSPRQRSPVR